jgi:rsbT co-antagonist protein RsbR
MKNKDDATNAATRGETMEEKNMSAVIQILTGSRQALLSSWLEVLKKSGTLRRAQISEAEIGEDAGRLLAALREGTATGRFDDITTSAWDRARTVIEEVSRSRAALGVTPSETATFVLSLKEPLFAFLREKIGADPERLAHEIWTATLLIDKLALYAIEAFSKSREDIILRQQEELLELSTPVVPLWEGILALPLIGTLDSARSQTVMESLLEEIVTTRAEIAIIDITGVPTVDTLVAQHLIKTVAAARLMGADCIISGIRPQIAQTIVHLGLELGIVSKATMADAFALALRRLGKMVTESPRLREER